MRNKAGIKCESIFEETIDYIDVDYTHLNKTVRYEKRPHGEWEKYGDKIEAYDIEGHKTWGQKRRCTNCGFVKTYIEDFGFYPFCPNCSALMYKKEGEAE